MPSEPRTCVGRVLSGLLAAVTLVSLCQRANASACPDTRIGKIEPTADGLRVDESAAQALRPGDVLIQLNSHRLRTCADLAEALTEARRHELATLFLIRRGGTSDVALVTAPAATEIAVPPAAAPPMATPVEPVAKVARAEATAVPPSPLPTTPPTPLTRADADAVREFLAKLMAFGQDVEARQPLPMAQPWAQRVDRLRQDYNSELARGAAVAAAEPILGYYETVAQILLYKEVATRERRAVRARADVVLEYHTSSPVGTWLQRYPFLRASVIREPELIQFIGAGESNGQWLPDRAIALLVEYAVSEGAVLSAKLAAAGAG